MTTVAPMMIFKNWVAVSPRFKHTDMNRISQNVATLASMVGVSYTAITVAQSDMFRYDQQNALEQAIKDICTALGLTAPMVTDWTYNQSVSLIDFDRVESNLYNAYLALRGEGKRIRWDASRKYDPFTLYKDNWTGSGPYYYNLPTSFGADYDEGLVFVRSEATVAQRMAEYRAIITVKSSSSGVVLQANGIKPNENIPIIITRGQPAMKETATLTASAWTGTGPWYQTITFANAPEDGVATITEDVTDAQAKEFSEAGISVSAVSDKNVTFRSMFKMPTIDLPIMLIYETVQWTI